MKIAIVFDSITGNTKLLANEIYEFFKKEDIVYFGEVIEEINADIYFVGSWTDKGMCSSKIAQFLNTLNNKTIIYFGTAGFGGDQSYFDKIFMRVKSYINQNNVVLESFMCQGKMPMTVKERYVKLITQNPEDQNLKVSIENFDEALNHPNQEDLNNLKSWLDKIKNQLI